MRHKIFYVENPHKLMEIKKPRGVRPTNLNPLFGIKLHKFTWSLYLKDLLFNTYNLIHVRDATTPCCSLMDYLVPLKGFRSLTNNSKI